jgi:hypothetical protein
MARMCSHRVAGNMSTTSCHETIPPRWRENRNSVCLVLVFHPVTTRVYRIGVQFKITDTKNRQMPPGKTKDETKLHYVETWR